VPMFSDPNAQYTLVWDNATLSWDDQLLEAVVGGDFLFYPAQGGAYFLDDWQQLFNYDIPAQGIGYQPTSISWSIKDTYDDCVNPNYITFDLCYFLRKRFTGNFPFGTGFGIDSGLNNGQSQTIFANFLEITNQMPNGTMPFAFTLYCQPNRGLCPPVTDGACCCSGCAGVPRQCVSNTITGNCTTTTFVTTCGGGCVVSFVPGTICGLFSSQCPVPYQTLPPLTSAPPTTTPAPPAPTPAPTPAPSPAPTPTPTPAPTPAPTPSPTPSPTPPGPVCSEQQGSDDDYRPGIQYSQGGGVTSTTKLAYQVQAQVSGGNGVEDLTDICGEPLACRPSGIAPTSCPLSGPTNAGCTFDMAIYADTANLPGAIMAATDQSEYDYNNYLMGNFYCIQLLPVPPATTVPVTNGQKYWFAIETSCNDTVQMSVNTGGSNLYVTKTSTTFGVWPASFGPPSTTGTGEISLYATCTPSLPQSRTKAMLKAIMDRMGFKFT
jgi:hypothetical protein